MPPAARVGDHHTCPICTGSTPHVGGPILGPGSHDVSIEKKPAAAVWDAAFCHGGVVAVIASGCKSVRVNGRMAARLGDLTSGGGAIVEGASTVRIGHAGDSVMALNASSAADGGGMSVAAADAKAGGAPCAPKDTFARSTNLGDYNKEGEVEVDGGRKVPIYRLKSGSGVAGAYATSSGSGFILLDKNADIFTLNNEIFHAKSDGQEGDPLGDGVARDGSGRILSYLESEAGSDAASEATTWEAWCGTGFMCGHFATAITWWDKQFNREIMFYHNRKNALLEVDKLLGSRDAAKATPQQLQAAKNKAKSLPQYESYWRAAGVWDCP